MSSSNWFIVSHHYKCWLGKHRVPMFQVIMTNLCRGPSIDVSYQISVHLGKWFQRRRFFLNRPIRNKKCPWWPCLLMDQDNMSNLYKGPSINYRCFLSNFSSFGWRVSEEKIKMWKVNGRQVMLKAMWAKNNI